MSANLLSRIIRLIGLVFFAQGFIIAILVFRLLGLGEVMSWAELRETIPH